MIEIEWTSRAFTVLETLPQAVAFEIIRQSDVLPDFPEIGATLETNFPRSKAIAS